MVLGFSDEGQDPKSAAALTEKGDGLEDPPDEVCPTFSESGSLPGVDLLRYFPQALEKCAGLSHRD
jgi:hypothetical protein